MRIHDLKILPQYFIDVLTGRKRFEVRYNDRNYRLGDWLILHEWTPSLGYTGRLTRVLVTYVLDDTQFCKAGYVILGIEIRGKM